MRIFFILIIMLVLHIFADFTLQGIMAQMKQYDWWKKERGSYDITTNSRTKQAP